jgi:ketosteroid isomerase-like protein
MTSLVDRFVEALRTFDVEAMTELLAPDAVAWRNIGNKDRTVDEVTGMLHVERELIPTSTVRVRQQATTPDGFVVQFVFAGTTRGGADFSVPICIVGHVTGERITAFEEYADETSLQPLWQEFAAMQAASS